MKLNHFPNANQAILKEDDSFSGLSFFIKQSNYSNYFVLVDSNTEKHCLPFIAAVFKGIEKHFDLLRIDAGEQSKTLSSCEVLWKKLSLKTADRKTLLINLGGGVVTDLGGFVASAFKRGIHFVNIPTSLLGMIDASIGGKCGVNFKMLKNQLGSFNPAILTILYANFLNTLPKRELASGFAEVIKHALIADSQYFERLEKGKTISLEVHEELITNSVKIKSQIVKLDPQEQGERKKLNFGHTIGHAVESYFIQKGNTIPHGFAVAIGMVCESYISLKLAGLAGDDLSRIVSLLQANYSKEVIPAEDFEIVLSFLKHDKKQEGGSNQFTLLNEIGSASINHEVESELIVESLTYYLDEF